MAIPVKLPESSPWRVQKLVLYGLMLREARTRFGPYKLGLVWAMAQPLATIAVLSFVLGFVLERTIPEIPYPMFLLSGYLPFGLFSGLIVQNLSCFRANQGLLVHNQVQPSDPFFARVFLEAIIFLLAFVVFVAIASWYFDASPGFSKPLHLLGAMLAVVMMGSGLGIFFAVLSWRFVDLEKVVPLLVHPLFFISCVLYPLQIVPSNYRWFFLSNPLVHVIETFRESLYPNYRTEDLSLEYPLLFGLALLWLGMAFYRSSRKVLYDIGRA